MKYFADLLTLCRLLLAGTVVVAILQHLWLAALIMYCVAIVTDMLDGIAARRWPYSSEDVRRLPWRRIDPHLLDNIPDSALSIGGMVALVAAIPHWLLIAGIFMGVSLVFIVLVQSFIRLGWPRAAEITDVVFGWWFTLTLVTVLVQLAALADVLTLTLIALGACAVPALALKWSRATSRPETRTQAEQYQSPR